MLLLSGVCAAQSDVPAIGTDLSISDLDVERASQGQLLLAPRELNVLRETLATEQLDRAVLNRLMQEIGTEPETTRTRLALNESQLQEVFITISNARGFINGSEMANVRAMCSAWESSQAQGDTRIAEALQAYVEREKLTQNFIARYYAVVLADIESQLDEESLSLFRAYMEDRRRRLANAGMSSWGSPAHNIRSGAASIEFHCR